VESLGTPTGKIHPPCPASQRSVKSSQAPQKGGHTKIKSRLRLSPASQFRTLRSLQLYCPNRTIPPGYCQIDLSNLLTIAFIHSGHSWDTPPPLERTVLLVSRPEPCVATMVF
jgi:hypothetical protein